MKLVLDTNVLISAFLAKGLCHTLLEECLNVHSVITSDFILDELRQKFSKKFKYSDRDIFAIENFLRSSMQVVEPGLLEKRVCRDPEDDMILATALAGSAVCIITGDQDLLILGRFRNIIILSPSEFTKFSG